MTKILFNKEGLPLMAYGEKFFATTTGSPAPPIKNNPVIETAYLFQYPPEVFYVQGTP